MLFHSIRIGILHAGRGKLVNVGYEPFGSSHDEFLDFLRANRHNETGILIRGSCQIPLNERVNMVHQSNSPQLTSRSPRNSPYASAMAIQNPRSTPNFPTSSTCTSKTPVDEPTENTGVVSWKAIKGAGP